MQLEMTRFLPQLSFCLFCSLSASQLIGTDFLVLEFLYWVLVSDFRCPPVIFRDVASRYFLTKKEPPPDGFLATRPWITVHLIYCLPRASETVDCYLATCDLSLALAISRSTCSPPHPPPNEATFFGH